MADKFIKYKKGYKYQLARDYEIDTGISIGKVIENKFCRMDSEGLLLIKSGYAWDGASGPAIDTLNFMRGSLVHDALYQFMRAEHLDFRLYRDKADLLLKEICIEDGMSRIRAWWVYEAVHLLGKGAAKKKNINETITAP